MLSNSPGTDTPCLFIRPFDFFLLRLHFKTGFRLFPGPGRPDGTYVPNRAAPGLGLSLLDAPGRGFTVASSHRAVWKEPAHSFQTASTDLLPTPPPWPPPSPADGCHRDAARQLRGSTDKTCSPSGTSLSMAKREGPKEKKNDSIRPEIIQRCFSVTSERLLVS